MSKVQLKDIASFSKGSQINGDKLIKNGAYDYLNGGISPSGKWNEYNVLGDSITISEGGNSCGYVNYMVNPFWCGAHCYYLFDLKCNKKYLYYALKSQQEKIMKLRSGACMPNIKKSDIGNFVFEFDGDINFQKQIAENLDKVTRTIELCNAILEKLDLLVKARFVEMFGDIQKNDKNWIERPLGEICEKIIRYPTFYGMDYIESGTRVIRIGNILNDGHMETNDDNYVFVYNGVNVDFPETVIEENDIVMAVRGDGSAAKRIGFITEKCLLGANISPNLIRIKADSNVILPIFLFYYLTGEIGQKRLDTYVNKTAKKNIAAKDIVKVISPVPPLDLQQQFAAFIEQIDKTKSKVKQTLEKAETLKKALMQKYFG